MTIKLDSKSNFEDLSQKMKYFDIKGKQYRCLPFPASDYGSGNVNFNETHTLFIRFKNQTKGVYSKDLEDKFNKYGSVLMARVALREDHTPAGYGYVTFTDSNSLQAALADYSKKANKGFSATV